MQIHKYRSATLQIEHFAPSQGESWCIYGSNGSGIDEFVRLLSGEIPEAQGLMLPELPAVISFSRQQEIFEEEMRNDDSDFLNRLDPGTPAHRFVRNWDEQDKLVQAFNLEGCRDKGYRQLSSGEGRKLMLLSALSRKPASLLLECPYDGIDASGCLELDHVMSQLGKLAGSSTIIIVAVNNKGDIPTWCTHLAIVQKGGIAFQGLREETLRLQEESCESNNGSTISLQVEEQGTAENRKTELVRLRDGFARYGDVEIFSGLNLSVRSGEHTLITGPNGSGKSTLLQIITGDNQNCYANRLTIFGIRRGSGESIWELKKDMGIVSPDLHRNHYIPGSPLQVVLSGFFDSIGIYRQFTSAQKEQALHWLEMIGLQAKYRVPFRSLSHAEQRLCLIARALIKMPHLLILDEPTQGLDQDNRRALLDFLETIAERRLSTILYASHRIDEFRSFFQQQIDLSSS